MNEACERVVTYDPLRRWCDFSNRQTQAADQCGCPLPVRFVHHHLATQLENSRIQTAHVFILK